MKLYKIKIFLLTNIAAIIFLNNLFLFTLANQYPGLDKVISPQITLRINKYKNREGITLNPALLISRKLNSKTQDTFQKIYLAFNATLILAITYKKREYTYYGTAKFASRDDIEKMDITHHEDDGVVLGMTKNDEIITHNGAEHIINMAPTRTGKGVCCVLPTLWTWLSSVIVNDIKGECWDLTSGYRRSVLKQKCIFFNPMDDTGEGISYNPLALVRVGTRSEQEDARTIAITLIDTDGKGESDHWISSAINLLTAVILHVKYVNINASFIDIMQFLEDPKEPLADKIGKVIGKKMDDSGEIVQLTEKDENGKEVKVAPCNHYKLLKDQTQKDINFQELYMQETYLHPIIGSTFATIFSTPDKERGSIFSTCINKLSIFKDPRVMVNIKKTDIVPKDLMNNRISLYLITPPKAIQMTKPLFRLIITQTIYELTDKMEFNNRKKVDEEKVKKTFDFKEKMENFIYKDPPKNPETLKNKKVLFLIDEFPALGNLSLFEQALAYIGGYGLKSLLIVQSINQLNKIYGKDNSIIDNCRVQLYFTPNDKDTPKMISDMMGSRTEKVITRSGRGILMENRSETFQRRELMTPGEVRVLPYESTLLLLSGQNPIIGKKIFWFKHKKYKSNADYNIPYPSYLRLLEKVEEFGADEFTLEYLIYLTKSYKSLKILVAKVGEKEFVSRILNSKILNEEIERIRNLNENDLLELKKEILSEKIKREEYNTNEDYEKELEKELQNLTIEKIIEHLKKLFYRDEGYRSQVKILLTENLKLLENSLDFKDIFTQTVIKHLKEKNVIDAWIPNISDDLIKFVEELHLKNSNVIENTLKILDSLITIDEKTKTVESFEYDISVIKKKLESTYKKVEKL